METIFLSADDIAHLLGTSRGNVYLLCRRGHLPFVKRGRRIAIPRPAWDAFVAERSATAMAVVREGAVHV